MSDVLPYLLIAILNVGSLFLYFTGDKIGSSDGESKTKWYKGIAFVCIILIGGVLSVITYFQSQSEGDIRHYDVVNKLDETIDKLEIQNIKLEISVDKGKHTLDTLLMTLDEVINAKEQMHILKNNSDKSFKDIVKRMVAMNNICIQKADLIDIMIKRPEIARNVDLAGELQGVVSDIRNAKKMVGDVSGNDVKNRGLLERSSRPITRVPTN
ncbi:hypothetical protein [Desulfolutivibrio sp.]|uniref:hypothetical protein n=1 Tax=Desulfolutivibrio sp. TaxID=2773296 RepID=UPI002F965D26